jgi:hypothetical protein
MALPSASEINVYGSLDELTALRLFLGKAIPEAVQIFRENSMLCGEALVHMGPRAQLFYIEAFLVYLASEDSRGDETAAAMLPSVADAIIESGLQDPRIRAQLLEALERIHSQFARYAPDRTTQRIYRHVPKEARKSIAALHRGMRT